MKNKLKNNIITFLHPYIMYIVHEKNTCTVDFDNFGTMILKKAGKKLTPEQIKKTIKRIEELKNEIINLKKKDKKELHRMLEKIISNMLFLVITDSPTSIIYHIYNEIINSIKIDNQNFKNLFNNSYNRMYQNIIE